MKHIAYPAMNLATGFLSQVGELNRLQWVSKAKIESRVLKHVRLVAAHAYENFRFYREKFDSARIRPDGIRSLEDFQRIPTVTKNELSAHLKEEHAMEHFSGIPTSTGGTTGRALAFLADPNASTPGLASRVFFDSWAGIGPHERKFALHRALTGSHMKDRIFLNEIQSSYTSLLTNPGAIYKRISNFRPKLIGSAALAVLADFMAKDGLTVGDWLKVFVTWGMPLSSEQLHSISKAFCSNIYDRYGSAELGGQVAQQCSERAGLHINTELCLIEVLRNSEPCADGERGRLVITNLSNLVTPFVRYEQKDTAVYIADCACGRTLPSITQIAGKDPSLIEMKNGVRIPQALLHSLVRRMKELSNVEQMTFRKTSSSSLILTLVPGQGFDLRNVERIREKLTSVLGSMADISVQAIPQQMIGETGRPTV